MITAVVVLVVIVQILQTLGMRLSKKLDRRNR